MIVLYFIPKTREFIYLFITLQIGIFLIIGYCFYAIIQKEKQFNEMANPANYVIKFDDCPDYFNKKYDAKEKRFYCANEYVVEHPLEPSKKAYMKIIKANLDGTLNFPFNHSNVFLNYSNNRPVPPNPTEKFYTDIFQKQEFKDTQARCTLIDETSPPPENVNDTIFRRADFKLLPWTSVKSRCNGLYGQYAIKKI